MRAGQIPECIHQNHVIGVGVDQSIVYLERLMYFGNALYGPDYCKRVGKQTTNLASITI